MSAATDWVGGRLTCMVGKVERGACSEFGADDFGFTRIAFGAERHSSLKGVKTLRQITVIAPGSFSSGSRDSVGDIGWGCSGNSQNGFYRKGAKTQRKRSD